MKYLFLIFIISSLGLSFNLHNPVGQSPPCDSVYMVVEEMPTFGSGIEDFFKEVGRRIKISKPCKIGELKRIEWTVTTEGEMVDIDVFGLERECKNEVIKQLKGFPLWTPGKLKGENVCVRMVMPIYIRTYE